MLHRTTWIAVPVVGLVVFGAAAGWWNYFGARQQNQALAYQAEMQYNSSFHGLATDMRHLEEELGKALITSDPVAFERRLRDVWRLSYTSQQDIARLPFGLMPMHKTQQFLWRLSEDIDTWSSNNANPKNASIRKQLQNFYTESNQLAGQLEKVQTASLNHTAGASWSVVGKALADGKQDNQIIDGFRKMDTQAAVYDESKDHPATMQRGRTFALRNEHGVTSSYAEEKFRQFLRVSKNVAWKSSLTQNGAYDQEYNITGTTSLGGTFGVVSKNGGHVLSFHIDRPVNTRSEIDFTDAQKRSEAFLEMRGFPPVQLQTANQYDGTGYYVYAPLYKGVPVPSQSIVVKVSLHDGVVTGYDGTNYFYHPVRSVPSRIYSVAQLQKTLNPNFKVGISREVIVLDDKDTYQPAVAFYGTNNRETYCLYVNAHTGKELTIDQLTNH